LLFILGVNRYYRIVCITPIMKVENIIMDWVFWTSS
jgi:hypothetical protein